MFRTTCQRKYFDDFIDEKLHFLVKLRFYFYNYSLVAVTSLVCMEYHLLHFAPFKLLKANIL